MAMMIRKFLCLYKNIHIRVAQFNEKNRSKKIKEKGEKENKGANHNLASRIIGTEKGMQNLHKNMLIFISTQ